MVISLSLIPALSIISTAFRLESTLAHIVRYCLDQMAGLSMLTANLSSAHFKPEWHLNVFVICIFLFGFQCFCCSMTIKQKKKNHWCWKLVKSIYFTFPIRSHIWIQPWIPIRGSAHRSVCLSHIAKVTLIGLSQ